MSGDQQPKEYKVTLLSKIEVVETHRVLAINEEEAVQIAKETPWEDFWENMVIKDQEALLVKEESTNG